MSRNAWLGGGVAASALAVAIAGCSSGSNATAPGVDAGVDAGGSVADAQSDTGFDAGHVDSGGFPVPSGVLDFGFNEGGIALTESMSTPPALTSDQASAITLDPQGSLVVVGSTRDTASTGDESVAAWRYLPNGTPDTTFSGDGAWSMSKTAGASDSVDLGTALCIDAAGNIVIAGTAHDATTPIDMAVWRLTSAGEVDATFNLSGHLTSTDVTGATGAAWDTANGVACSSTGLTVAGFTDTQPAPINAFSMVLWHYLSTGALDTTGFNAPSGYVAALNVTGTEPSPGDSANAVAVDAMGRIVVAGAGPDMSGDYNAALWRYTAAGVADITFNGTGHATFIGAAGSTSLTAVAMAFDAAQNIVLVSTGSNGASGLAVVGRVTSAGVPDATFGMSGFVQLLPPASSTFAAGIVLATGVAIDSQGRIVVSGSIAVGATLYVAAWRLLPSGVLDSAFGRGGVFAQTGAAGGLIDGANGVAVDAHDRAILVGSSQRGGDAGTTTAMAIWRLTP